MTTYVVLEPHEWGMRWANPPVFEHLLDPETYIHHRAGNGHHTRDAAQVFYEMNEGAITNKGYSATDYDILVHENTVTDTVTIGIARGAWRSAATLDRNEEGEAICALGYYHPGHKLSERPSPAMLEGLALACAISIERGWSAPDTKVPGHRDNPAHPDDTGCPGDWLYPYVSSIGARALELVAERSAPPVPDPDSSENDMTQIALGRPRGASDAYILIPATGEALRRMGMLGQPAVVFDVDLDEFERAVGYELTRRADGN